MDTIDIFEKINPEAYNAFNKSCKGDTFNIAQTVSKVVIFAKQNGILPGILDSLTETPEDIASLSAKIAFAIDTIKRLVDGDLDTYEKLLNHIVDIAYVIAVSTADEVAKVGPELIKMAAGIVAEFFSPGSGEIVGDFIESISKEISAALLTLNTKLLKKFKYDAKKDLQAWFNSLREKELATITRNKQEDVVEEEDEETITETENETEFE